MRRNLLLMLLLAVVVSACKSVGDYVWADDVPQAPVPTEKEYVIAIGDTISVRVWNQEGLSTRARVRSDGKISLPFLNDVEAAGVTPNVLAKRLQARLKEFIVNPVVTISLEERRAAQVSVVGEVMRAGSYELQPGAGVLQALAAAGGMNEFASRDRIFVIRQNPNEEGSAPLRIRFTYESLTQIKGRAATFRLQPGDVVVVE